MIELPEDDFASARTLLDGLQHGASIASAVLSGHTQGRVFVAAPADARTGFFYDNGFCVVAGAADAQFARACLKWLYQHAGQDFFILYPGDGKWVAVLDTIVASPVRKVGRIRYAFDAAAFSAHGGSKPLPPEFTGARMNAALLRQIADGGYPWILGTWKSERRFEQDGLGFCVLAHGRVASLCYSVFASGPCREIDILTMPQYRRQGLAKAAASAYIRDCLDAGLQPGWDCFEDNVASRGLAQELGFVPDIHFPVYSWQRPKQKADHQ